MAWLYGKTVNGNTADTQSHDLYAAHGNRLLKGLEYTARYNLGHDVPFETWQD
jgi:hypothetical protein